MTLSATSQLLERLTSQQEVVGGELYGLVPASGKPSAVAMALVAAGGEGQELGHPPSLLLPPPMTRLGIFKVTEGDLTCPDLEDGEVCVVWNQRGVVWYRGGGGSGVEVEVEVLTSSQVNALFGVAKVSFTLELWCRHSTRDTTPTPNIPTHINSTRGNAGAVCDELESPVACFRVRGGRLTLQAGGGGGGGVLCGGEAGVVGGDAAGGVLFKAGGGKKKAGSGVGAVGVQEAVFQLVYNRSVGVVEGEATPAAAPVVRVDNCAASVVCAVVSGEAVAYLDKGSGVGQVGGVLAGAVAGVVRLAEHWLALQRGRPELRGALTALATLPPAAGHLVGLVYPACQGDEALRWYRTALHRALLFPVDRPMVRLANALTPPPGTRPSALTCPHAALAPPPSGVVSVVRGGYAYYHYQQGKVEDKGWGCAYRSLQTIVSWYQLQGYTARPVPSHRAIQQCLVDIGDKPADFVGSKRWIGSAEVGFVLDTMFGVDCRFLCVASGGELAGHGGQLAHHFDTQGTPIMVGGGVLAHTILGVAVEEATQQATAFLVLDPHYTGPDDTTTVTAKGGVAWKTPDFWKTDAFYNLCMPQIQHTI